MSKYKYRLIKDLPEYPKDCVFIYDGVSWHGYWDGGNWKIPEWLEQLLYINMPEVSDDMTDFFEPIRDEESTVYEVNILGEIRELQIYDFWINTENTATRFIDRKEAEKVAKQIRQIFKDTK